jgi:cellobiose transport system substrate-binding protein
MSVTKHRLRKVAAVALVGFVALGAAAACSKSNTPAAGSKPDKLIVDTFGEFGYDDLVKQYTQQTGIKVELRKTAQLGDYRPKLVRYLATGKGAGDVVALEEGIINEFKINPANWVDLTPLVGDKSADYLSWKYALGKAPDGKLMGLPTDVGSLAVCYRRDLLQAAGLPADRDQVSALWPTWDKFIETGKTYKAKTGKALLDSVTTAASAIIFQVGGDSFYNANMQLYPDGADTSKAENLVAANSPAVKQAWDTSLKMVDAGITAKVKTWSPEWSAGFKNGTFAATFCPSWMTGIVSDNSGPGNAGKWDVAAVPGGSGNWGGSWLAVPTQSKYQAEAAKLAAFLTSAQSQVAAFKLKGPLPTNLTALKDPGFTSYQNAYFNNAPTGKIFGESVANIKPLTLGPKHGAVKERAFEPALQAYEGGQLSADAAWKQFLTDVPIQGAY